jgi:hypothetical protein
MMLTAVRFCPEHVSNLSPAVIAVHPQGEEVTVNNNPAQGSHDNRGPKTYLFLCSLLWPFIESYWLATNLLLPQKKKVVVFYA